MRFSEALLGWASQHGRAGLPWHPAPGESADPYRVWLSEIMLQQTQLASMLPYYERFVGRFPTLQVLAEAPLEAVLAAWSGLGYYARARNLHRAAQQMATEGLPQLAADWARLPGVGESTAAAIASVVSGERVAILDGNVRRVLARQICAPEPWGSAALTRRLWPEARARLPESETLMPAYTQAIMDLGALVCLPRRPACGECPVRVGCRAFEQDVVDAYPRPAVRRVRPVRQQDWLLLVHSGSGAAGGSEGMRAEGVKPERWALVRRPPTGIWGGLLALPATETIDAQADQSPFVGMLEAMGQLRHDFTHFRLEARIWTATVDLASTHLHPALKRIGPGLAEHWPDDAELVWLAREEALSAGIPTPLRRLLLAA